MADLEKIIVQAYEAELLNVVKNYFKESYIETPDKVLPRTREGIIKINSAYELLSKCVVTKEQGE